MNTIVNFAQKTVAARWFERSIIILILINAVLLGAETFGSVRQEYSGAIHLAYNLILLAFILEAVLKLAAHWPTPQNYFKDGWNVFDFTIILLSFLPVGGSTAMVARMVRLLRVLRLMSALPELRVLVSTLLRSLPGIANVGLLIVLIVYVYAVAGYHFFHDVDPKHWGNLWLACLTLFQIITLEAWADLMYTAMAVKPWAWVYFVSFVIIATFVVINLFVALVLENLEGAREEVRQPIVVSQTDEDLQQKLLVAKAALAALEQEINKGKYR